MIKRNANTPSGRRAKEIALRLIDEGIKPTPRAMYRELHGKEAGRGVAGMRLLSTVQGWGRTEAMRERGWKMENGYWRPPASWVPKGQRTSTYVEELARQETLRRRGVQPRKRLGEIIDDAL